MALVISGKSKCPICGKVLEKGQEITSFSPFVSNKLDPLWFFNDAAFHTECFRSHPMAEKAQARFHELKERTSDKVCLICSREITRPDDYLSFGHLTEDNNQFLYQYNYAQFHRTCLVEWPELPQVIEKLGELKASGKWEGIALDWLIDQLQNIQRDAAHLVKPGATRDH